MARRKVRDEDEARALLEGLEASGVGLARWAHLQGVDGRSLNAWRLNLEGRRAPTSQPLRVVELVPRSSTPAMAAMTIRCGPFVVEVHDQVGDDLLARVLAVVAAC